MTFDMVLKLLGALSPVVAVATFIIGQKKGLKTSGYEQGVKDTTLKLSLDNLAEKVDEALKEVKEVGILKQRIIALEKAVFNQRKEVDK